MPESQQRVKPLAYPVPFTVQRLLAGRLRLINASTEQLYRVALFMSGPGVMRADPIGDLAPGAHLEARVKGDDLARATAIVVRWFRANGVEYLWRVTF